MAGLGQDINKQNRGGKAHWLRYNPSSSCSGTNDNLSAKILTGNISLTSSNISRQYNDGICMIIIFFIVIKQLWRHINYVWRRPTAMCMICTLYHAHFRMYRWYRCSISRTARVTVVSNNFRVLTEKQRVRKFYLFCRLRRRIVFLWKPVCL